MFRREVRAAHHFVAWLALLDASDWSLRRTHHALTYLRLLHFTSLPA